MYDRCDIMDWMTDLTRFGGLDYKRQDIILFYSVLFGRCAIILVLVAVPPSCLCAGVLACIFVMVSSQLLWVCWWCWMIFVDCSFCLLQVMDINFLDKLGNYFELEWLHSFIIERHGVFINCRCGLIVMNQHKASRALLLTLWV